MTWVSFSLPSSITLWNCSSNFRREVLQNLPPPAPARPPSLLLPYMPKFVYALSPQARGEKCSPRAACKKNKITGTCYVGLIANRAILVSKPTVFYISKRVLRRWCITSPFLIRFRPTGMWSNWRIHVRQWQVCPHKLCLWWGWWLRRWQRRSYW